MATINYTQLAKSYNKLFEGSGFHINENWLRKLSAQSVDVSNPNKVAEILSTQGRYQELAQNLINKYNYQTYSAPELAQQFQLREAIDAKNAVNEKYFVDHFLNKSPKDVGSSGGGSNPQSLEFNPEEYYSFKQPSQGGFTSFIQGLKSGMSYGSKDEIEGFVSTNTLNPLAHVPYSRSQVFDRAPSAYWEYRDDTGKTGFTTGRVLASLTGHGDRKYAWTVHPMDLSWTYGSNFLKNKGESNSYSKLGGFLTGETLGLVSGNYNPFNLLEGGRGAGYSAISPEKDDPRKSTNPVTDIAQRAFLGRTGKLLPWEQYTLEKPDVSHEAYSNYRDWLYGKTKDPIGNATLGLVKVYDDDEVGTDIRIVGYHTTPLGIVAATSVPLALGLPSVRKVLHRFIN